MGMIRPPEGGGHRSQLSMYDQHEDDGNVAELEQQLQEALSFCAKQKKTIEEQTQRIQALESHINDLTVNSQHGGMSQMNGAENRELLLEGFLMKRDPHGPRMLRGWKKRWSILTRTTLRYFENRDASPKGEILMSSIVTVDRQVSDKMKQIFVISIRESARIYEFKAESSTECGDWVTAIKSEID
eukprot:TRINITY_DN1846_c0_g1_i1.p1 TRINITY_DN1846_c0_g1~~TRINITY_DN1846_c0_g1_i1.p1  ORF type:complete len:186 (-),score=30.00 TRINITY_DN1846_c0_g1_i1:106-663(-)